MWLGGSSEINIWLNVQADSSLLHGSHPYPGKLYRKIASGFVVGEFIFGSLVWGWWYQETLAAEVLWMFTFVLFNLL